MRNKKPILSPDRAKLHKALSQAMSDMVSAGRLERRSAADRFRGYITHQSETVLYIVQQGYAQVIKESRDGICLAVRATEAGRIWEKEFGIKK